MIMQDLHVHTTYCDGKNTPEEMVIAAIDSGLESIGFSVHSYTFFDESYCIKKNEIENYKVEINELKERYADKIRILCGVEQDYYSQETTEGFDFVIGSVHYVKMGNEYIPVDENAEILKQAVERLYNGNFYLLAEEYFRTVADVVERTGADIIGHIDLISKFNEKYNLFNEKNEKYVNAYKTAVDKLVTYNVPFEINTGAISRGYKSHPYPSLDILNYIKSKKGKTILNSDSHSKDTLCFQFDKWKKYL